PCARRRRAWRTCSRALSARPGRLESASVPEVVEAAVLSALDGTPPGFVGPIPLDGRVQALLEGVRRRPARLAAQLRGIERVAEVVPGTVGDRPDERLGLAHAAEDLAREVAVRALVVGADVVHLSAPPPAQDDVERRAMILDV